MKKRGTISPKKLNTCMAITITIAMAGAFLMPVQALEGHQKETRATIQDQMVVPNPMKVLDFNQGLNELVEKRDFYDEYFEIIPSDRLYVQKKPEELDTGELVDANGIVYFGKEENVHYYKKVVSNQPMTNYSRERGTYIQMGKTRIVPPVYKLKPAGLANQMESAILDKELPYETTMGAVSGQGVLIQDEYIAYSEMAVANPFAGEDISNEILQSGGLAFSYWIKAPAYDKDTYEPAAVLRWEDTAGEGELQIDLDNSIFWGDKDTVIPVSCYAIAGENVVSPVNAVSGNGAVSMGSNCDKWHQVTVNLTDKSVEFYLDGICVDVKENYETYTGWDGSTGLLEWITDENVTLHFGGKSRMAVNSGLAAGSCDFAIDDLKFYGEMLTDEEVFTAYNGEVADRNKPVDLIGKPVEMGIVTDVSVDVEDAVHTNVENISGEAVYSVKVDKNNKIFASTAALISNPFAGKAVEGVTLGYWVKQDEAANSSVISFIDEEKDIYNPKGEWGWSKSILYVENTGLTIFAEGYFDASVCNSVQNLFYAAPDEEGQKAVLEKSTEWMYITLSMDNMGVRYYVNGKPAADYICVEPTSRFLDGYYVSKREEPMLYTRLGMFGSTGNQGTTTMMEFLTGADTKLYLGYYPTKGGFSNNKTAGCSFAGFKYTETALNDEEVQEFYENRYVGLEIPENPSEEQESPEPSPSESPKTMAGDVTGDGKVTLADAQKVLKAALKIENLENSLEKAADVDKNEKINLTDAQIILKIALKIMEL